MPTDGNEFTLGLFDQTALSGWNAQALQAALTNDHADPPEDADTDTVSAPPRSSAVSRGTNFRLVGERDLARGWPARARDNIAAIQLSKELEQTGRIPTAGGAGAIAPLHRVRRDRAGAELFPPPRRGRFPARLGGDRHTRSKPPSPRRNTPPCSAPPSTPTTRRRRSSAPSGARPNGWAFPAGGCWNPAWAPACSSPCCRKRCARAAGSPASSTTRSPPASRAWCIPRPGCVARTTRGARSAAASTWSSATRPSPIASFAPIPRPARCGCACTTTSSPARSHGCAPAASPCSSPAPARWTRPAPPRANTSPAWRTWWARCACPRAACAPAPAPTS